MKDAIRPAHYREGRKYEPKDVIRDWELNFNLGSSVKYLSRAGRKGDIIEDLEKAKQFIQFEIDHLKEERKENIMQEIFAEHMQRNGYNLTGEKQ